MSEPAHQFIRSDIQHITLEGAGGLKRPGRRVTVQSIFPYPADLIWSELQRTESLQFVCRPLLYFTPRDTYRLPEYWREGETARLYLWGLGFLPFGKHDINLEWIDASNYIIQSRERGSLMRTWDHFIHLEPEGNYLTRYTDQITLEAGVLTSALAWWTRLFYRHRQRRWQELLGRV